MSSAKKLRAHMFSRECSIARASSAVMPCEERYAIGRASPEEFIKLRQFRGIFCNNQLAATVDGNFSIFAVFREQAIAVHG